MGPIKDSPFVAHRRLKLSTFRRIFGTLVIALGLLGLSHGSWGRVPQQGRVRLSWRTNGEKIKVPRVQDPNLPAHMKLPEGQAFDVYIRPYQLKVLCDGKVQRQLKVVAPGMRHDRPLSVFEEVSLPPGQHTLEVIFDPMEVEGAPSPEPAQPYRVGLEVEAGKVYLLTLDENGGWLLKKN